MIPKEITEAVMSCAKGDYQESLLQGYARWSGADLKGKARKYGAAYAESRGNLWHRICKTLSPLGWSVYDGMMPWESRLQRRLVLIAPDGSVWDWVSEKPAALPVIVEWDFSEKNGTQRVAWGQFTNSKHTSLRTAQRAVLARIRCNSLQNSGVRVTVTDHDGTVLWDHQFLDDPLVTVARRLEKGA